MLIGRIHVGSDCASVGVRDGVCASSRVLHFLGPCEVGGEDLWVDFCEVSTTEEGYV